MAPSWPGGPSDGALNRLPTGPTSPTGPPCRALASHGFSHSPTHAVRRGQESVANSPGERGPKPIRRVPCSSVNDSDQPVDRAQLFWCAYRGIEKRRRAAVPSFSVGMRASSSSPCPCTCNARAWPGAGRRHPVARRTTWARVPQKPEGPHGTRPPYARAPHRQCCRRASVPGGWRATRPS